MLSCWTMAVIVFWSLKPFLRFSRAGRLLQWLSGKEPFCNTGERETWVWSLGWEDPLEEGMAIHSSIVAFRILKDGGTWGAMDHRVTKSRTRLSTHACKQGSLLLSTLFSDNCVQHKGIWKSKQGIRPLKFPITECDDFLNWSFLF